MTWDLAVSAESMRPSASDSPGLGGRSSSAGTSGPAPSIATRSKSSGAPPSTSIPPSAPSDTPTRAICSVDRPPAQIIVADPPWRFASNSQAKPGRNAMRHYPCMTDAEIADLPVRALAARDALLFLWTTAPMLPRSLAILDAWGFRYASQIVWIKDKIGTGFWARNQHEICIIARRGRFPCHRPAPFPTSVIRAPVREHSRKPEALQDRIDARWPDEPKLEMFGRRPRDGWQVWGNDTGKFDAATQPEGVCLKEMEE